MDFNTFCTNKNRKKHCIGELQNLQRYYNCVSTLPEKIQKHTKQHDRGRPFPALRLIEQSCATFAESRLAFIVSSSC